MLKPWRFKTKDHKVLVVSDTHWHHDRDFLWKPRGYSSIQEHDVQGTIIWNNKVGPDDTVLHLGDFVFKADYDLAVEYLSQLNGHIIYLWGNHNSGVKQIYEKTKLEYFKLITGRDITLVEEEIYPLTFLLNGKPKLTFAGDYMHGKVDHVEFVACHYAFRVWDKQAHGVVNLCGHSHGNDKGSTPDCTTDKRCDMGIENFGGPIEFHELMKIMNKKQIVVHDHHDSTTTSSSF